MEPIADFKVINKNGDNNSLTFYDIACGEKEYHYVTATPKVSNCFTTYFLDGSNDWTVYSSAGA